MIIVRPGLLCLKHSLLFLRFKQLIVVYGFISPLLTFFHMFVKSGHRNYRKLMIPNV